MSRPFARLKLGYYPLPTEEARNIHSVLVASAPYCAIDPCAGDGSALLEITNGTGAHLAAIEVDADRAVAAAQRGIPTVHGSAFECKVQSESCSLLYLNPPYDTELGPHSNKRMEFVFLDHCYRWVRTDGSACSASAILNVFASTKPWFSVRVRNHIRGVNREERMCWCGPDTGRIRSQASIQVLGNATLFRPLVPRRSTTQACR